MAEITASMVKDLRERSGAGMMDCKKALIEVEGDFDKAMNLLRERGIAKSAKRGGRVAKEGLISAKISADGKTGVLVELNSETDFVSRNDDFKAMSDKLAVQAVSLAAGADFAASDMGGVTVAAAVEDIAATIGEKIVLSRTARLDAAKGAVVSYIHPPGKIGVLVEFESENAGLAADAGFQEIGRVIAMHVAAIGPMCVRREEVPAATLENERGVYRNQTLNEGKPEAMVDKIVEGRINKYYAEVCLLEQPFVQDDKKKVEQVVKDAGAKLGGLSLVRFVRFQLGETATAEEAAE